MFYPEEMTREEIEQFEYEYNRFVDMDRGEGPYWAVNAELQVIAAEQREFLQDFRAVA